MAIGEKPDVIARALTLAVMSATGIYRENRAHLFAGSRHMDMVLDER